MQGWIKLHRSLLDWGWWDDPNTTRLFLYLLLKANHSDKSWKGTLVKRGQLITGRISLSNKTGLTQQQIRTSLTKLKSTSEITIKTTNKYSLISINNWDNYQQDNQQTTKRVTNKQPASNHKQECKELKNVKKYISIDKISNKDLKEIADKYKVPLHFVESKYEDMVNWHESTGSVRKDWIATLRNFVKKDKGKVKLETFEPKNKENLEKVRFMKQKLGMI